MSKNIDEDTLFELVRAVNTYRTLSMIEQNATLTGAGTIKPIGQMFTEDATTNGQYWMSARETKTQLNVVKEKELVFMITLVGALLFSTVLMYMVLQFPNKAWIMSAVISTAMVAGVIVGAFAVKADSSIIGGVTIREDANKSALEKTLNLSMPFIIFTAVIGVISAIAALMIWSASRNNTPKKIDEGAVESPATVADTKQ